MLSVISAWLGYYENVGNNVIMTGGVMRYLILLFGLTIMSGAGWSAVIHVPGEQPTIQAGIDAALPGDTVLVAAGTYTGNGNRDIDFSGKNIVLKSENGPDFTIIDCQGDLDYPHRGFIFHSGEDSTAVVDGFTIQGGYGLNDSPDGLSVGGGIYCLNSSPTISNNTISRNLVSDDEGPGRGGGISCEASSPTIRNNHINANSAGRGWGGGIYCDSSNATISNNTIFGNLAHSGGGIDCGYSSDVTITNNVIIGNSAAYGGGIYGSGSSSTTPSAEIRPTKAAGFMAPVTTRSATLSLLSAFGVKLFAALEVAAPCSPAAMSTATKAVTGSNALLIRVK